MNGVTYNFLVPASSDGDLSRLSTLDVDKDWKQFNDGVYCWSLLSYLILRERGLPVTRSMELVEGAINIGHHTYLERLGPQRGRFVVCCQAEYRRLPWAQLHIVQNKTQLRERATTWLPLWPQAGLVPRDKLRREVSCVAYAGRRSTFGGKEEYWRAKLSDLNMTFCLLDEDHWNDMSEVDILLAVRSFDGRMHDRKPPTKLINGWLAGVPVIAGHDSAYSQIGTPQCDYIVVSNEQEAIVAIKNLKENRQQYAELVSSGRDKAKLFSRAHVADAWQMTLGELDRRYDSWRRRSHVANVAWTAVVWHHAATKRLVKLLR